MHSEIILAAAKVVPEGRVFGLDAQALIGVGLQLFNGIILAVALGFILYKPVKAFLDQRSEKIQNRIDDSNATMTKATELINQYDTKLKDVDQERIQILEASRVKANDEMDTILAEARDEANEIKKEAAQRISEDKKRLQEETRLYIVELASLMTEKYLVQNIDQETQNKFFEEALAQLEDAQWQG